MLNEDKVQILHKDNFTKILPKKKILSKISPRSPDVLIIFSTLYSRTYYITISYDVSITISYLPQNMSG